MPDNLLTCHMAAKQAGTTAARVKRLCEAGKVPGATKNDLGAWRIPADSIGHITPAEREAYNEWTQHEIALLGTDTDPRVGAQIGRSGEAVRDMRQRCDIQAFPTGRGVTLEMQIPRMTKARLLSLKELIDVELKRRD